MYVDKLLLRNFRNYEMCEINFSDKTNVIYGPNGIGKTNILEAFYFLSYARSHRNSLENELIRFNNERADISAAVNLNNSRKNIEISLFKNKKKQIKVNRVPINKTSDLLGFLNAVMFCPENLKIVKGAPGERRRTIDMGICRYGKKYFGAIREYAVILDQRNRLLKDDPENETLEIWTEKLAKAGAVLCMQRKHYIDKLSAAAKVSHKEICGEELNLEYKCGINIEDFSEEKKVYEKFYKELNRSLYKDKRFGVTVYGCHRDDFKIYVNGFDSKMYASQGQQRTAAVSIKMAELNMLKNFYGDSPVLLLDDVLSELDGNRQEYILHSIKDAQVIITCTDADRFSGFDNINLINAEKLRCLYT